MSLESKFKGLVCASLLSASFLLGCEKNESPTVNSNNVQQIEQPVVYPDYAKYFPIHEGNEWKYEIEIPRRGQLYLFRRYRVPLQNNKVKQLNSRAITQDLKFNHKYELHLRVDEKVSEQGTQKFEDAWKLGIVKDDIGLFNDMAESFLVRFPERSRFTRDIGILNIYNDKTTKSMDTEGAIAPPESLDYLFYHSPTNDNKTEVKIENQIMRLDKIGVDWKVGEKEYKNCLIYIKAIPPAQKLQLPPGMQQPFFAPSEGWSELLIFAPDVGLIQKIQFDYNNKQLYNMSLVDYKIK